MALKSKTYFLTGATGLLGSYLTKILLEDGNKVYALARSKNNKPALQRVVDILNFWDETTLKRYRSNLIVFEGDITKEGLGLEKSHIRTLKNEVEEIFHCAAAIEFNWPIEEIRKVNVEGTKNLLNLALTLKNLKKTNHISTVYVCGTHKGTFSENDLDVSQSFNTTYEQSKFESEKAINQYRNKGLWVDIFRPPIVVGESISGKTIQFKHLYQFWRVCSMAIFDILPLPDGKIYITSVDLTAQAIYLISKMTKQRNKFYHPFSTKGTTLQHMLNIAAKELRFRKPKFISKYEFEVSILTPTQKNLLLNNIFYINTDVKFTAEHSSQIFYACGFDISLGKEEFFKRILHYAISRGFLKKRKITLRK